MSLKVHFFLHWNFNIFPQNYGDISDEYEERFHQETKKQGMKQMGPKYGFWLLLGTNKRCSFSGVNKKQVKRAQKQWIYLKGDC